MEDPFFFGNPEGYQMVYRALYLAMNPAVRICGCLWAFSEVGSADRGYIFLISTSFWWVLLYSIYASILPFDPVSSPYLCRLLAVGLQALVIDLRMSFSDQCGRRSLAATLLSGLAKTRGIYVPCLTHLVMSNGLCLGM